MRQIKTFWNESDKEVNSWIKENNIRVIDIKVSISTNEDSCNDCILVIHETEEK